MKKSKILLTLVVLVLVCSMLFALVACNNDKKEDNKDTTEQQQQDENKPGDDTTKPGDDTTKPEVKPDKPAVNPNKGKNMDAMNKIIANAMVKDLEKANEEGFVGFEYGVEVPVANTEAGESRVVIINIRGKLSPKTPNANKLELSAFEKIANGKPAETFALMIDDKDVYLRAKDANSNPLLYKFPSLELGEMISHATFSETAVRELYGKIGGIGGMFYSDVKLTEKDGVKTFVAPIEFGPALGQVADLLPDMIAGLIGGDSTSTVKTALSVIMPQIVTFMKDIKPVFTIVADANDQITSFKIDVTTKFGDGHVLVAPKLGGDVEPAFTDMGKLADYKTTAPLNFTLNGNYVMGADTYAYDIRANIDVFCILKNLALKGTKEIAANPEVIFDGSTTKLFVNVAKANETIISLAMDPENFKFNDIVLAFNPAKVLPTTVVDMLFTNSENEFNQKLGAALKEDKMVSMRINPAALLADNGQADSSKIPAAKKDAAPELVVYVDEASPLKAQVSWYPEATAEEYIVLVNGVKVAITDEANTNELGDYFVNVKSGDVVEVSTESTYVAKYVFEAEGPALIAEETAEGGIVSWTKAEGVTYEVYVDGNKVAVEGSSVKVISNQTVTVVATYADGAVAKSSYKFVSDKGVKLAVFTGIEFLSNTVKNSIADGTALVIDSNKLVEFIASIDNVINVDVNGNTIADVVKAVVGVDTMIKLNVSQEAKFFDFANVTENFATKFLTNTKLTADDLKVIEFEKVGKTNFVSLGANYDANGAVVPMTKEAIVEMVKVGNKVNGATIGKVVGLDYNKTDVQTVKIIIINNVPANFNGLFTAVGNKIVADQNDFGNADAMTYFPTQVIYTQVQVKAAK